MHGLVLTVLMLTVLAPLHRSYIFTLLLVISGYVLLRKSTGQRAVYVAIMLLVTCGISTVDVISSRLGKGIHGLYRHVYDRAGFGSGQRRG